jgi:hypothetical protein
MTADAVPDVERTDDQEDVPLGGYAVLAGAFTTAAAVYAGVARSRGLRLPERVPPWAVALLGTATYEAARLLSRDKVTSFVRAPFTRRTGEALGAEVMDEPRGRGARRAVGDLVSCPFLPLGVGGGRPGGELRLDAPGHPSDLCGPRRRDAGGLAAICMDVDAADHGGVRSEHDEPPHPVPGRG